MIIDLSKKVALVTGGSSGIGRETSILLSRSGAKVIINYEQSKKTEVEKVRNEITHNGLDADTFQADISIPEEVDALFDYIREKYKRLDILVNNAGIAKDNLLLSMKLTEWDRVLNVNLRGAFICTKLAAEMMMANHSGKIINISSTAAIRGTPRLSSYASSKGGLISFTRVCAVELAAKGIQVNAVVPGLILTNLSKKAIKKGGDYFLKKIPTSRFGEPADVANLVVFLCSQNTDYITGQAICVDGGFSIS